VQRFEARNHSVADVPVPRAEIWDVVSSPTLLARMTPLVSDITVDGERWCWQLAGISALGVEVAPAFTERMTFVEPERIEFEHDPAEEGERAGARGVYALVEDGPERTRLEIDITIHVLLPLPRVSRRAVERIMRASMQRTGDVFAERLYEHLGIDPADASTATVTA
jgi:carbon monoxide dehydrogenase subunit G